MKNSKVLKGVLVLLGLVLIILGSWRLINPVTFFENSGLILSNDVGLLNEARATGGVVVGFGMLVLMGAFFQKLSYTSAIVAIVIFLSFGMARLIGFAIDGNPGEKLIQGVIFEFVFGLLGMIVFFKYREK